MTKKANKALIDFMMEKLGGEAAVMQQLYSARVAEMAEAGSTLEELDAEARKDDWAPVLWGMPLKDLARVILPESSHVEPVETTGGGGKRLSKAGVENLRERILEFVEQNAWCAKNPIAEAVGFDKSKIGPQLRALREEGKIQKIGNKAGTKYALVNVAVPG